MILNMKSYEAKDAFLGTETRFTNGVLTIHSKELQERLLQDEDQIESVDLALAKPGNKTRIIHILDAIEPRIKEGGGASPFPGLLGPPHRVGHGVTNRLAGMAVLTCAEFPEYDPDSMMGANEGVVDMAGPGAVLSPFGNTINLALVFKRKKQATTEGFHKAIRIAGFKTAAYLAEAVKETEPNHETQYSLERDGGLAGLPRIAHVCLLSSLSLPLRESFIYGYPVGGMLPTALHPNEMLDGAVVGNYYIYSGVRNPTYFYQNNPILQELYKKHGKELNLVGVILSRAGDTSTTGKLNQAAMAAGLAKLMQIDGVIVSANAGGQQLVDFMFVCQQCEKRGIKAVGIVAEMANQDGADFGFPIVLPEADALVSTGNREELVDLPPMETVVGGDKILDREGWAGKPLIVPLRHVYGSGTQIGAWNIAAEAF
ncbi:MAG: glycine/sarcosine/betaine reductase component B subunit [Thermodesulfobacteriota bacterium]|nr:glycine/sarcosine/betaine reductase component B subunit [Thermodesulfobacteriota bacterium]